MVNSSEFSKRLQKVIDYYDESASSFAEKIGVQRSSISHIISGRNKPSLDFVMKILDTYPNVSLYWLLNGKGSFPEEEVKQKSKVDQKPIIQKNEQTQQDLFNQVQEAKISPEIPTDTVTSTRPKTSKQIEQIVVFYTDGSFKRFVSE